MKLKILILCLATLFGASCSTITIHPEKGRKLASAPNYQETKKFFFWGLVGERRIDVQSICGEKKVVQMQSQQTFGNGALTFITLGIYAPHSVKIWCE